MSQLLFLIAAIAIFGAVLAALAVFAVQLIVLMLTERRLRSLRWAPLAAPALVLCCGVLRRSVVGIGAAGAFLLGWALAWALYKFSKWRESREKTDPDL